ncbi:MAG: NAD-dependent epimerase/dehydratase family protein, partial [Actinomycetota bacterium]|nr:NAD-dependent epimerase/dehydratase family protein [Actinomycetota bacterium]
MRLLVLGGTLFLGRHIVDAALARGHEVTTFNRGRTNPELFTEVEKLRGDREADLSALAGRTWDAAIDVHGRMPSVVRPVAALLADAVEHFTFVSSISAYGDVSRRGL